MADLLDFSAHEVKTNSDGTVSGEAGDPPIRHLDDLEELTCQDVAHSPGPHPDDHVVSDHDKTTISCITVASASNGDSDIPGSNATPDDCGKEKLDSKTLIIDVESTSGTSDQGSPASLSLSPDVVATEEGGPSLDTADGGSTGLSEGREELDVSEEGGLSDAIHGDTPQALSTEEADELASLVSGASSQSTSCRICRTGTTEDEPIIDLGCSCQAGLGSVHKPCADKWFQRRGNRKCEVCGQIAENIDEPPKLETGPPAPPLPPAVPPVRGVRDFLEQQTLLVVACVSVLCLVLGIGALGAVAYFLGHGKHNQSAEHPGPGYPHTGLP